MTFKPVLRGASKVLKAMGGAAGVAWFFIPFNSATEFLLNIALPFAAILCFGAGIWIEMELDIPKLSEGSKYDPSKPLGL